MRIPILGLEIDERFFRHRQRSTSIASVVGAWVAAGLLAYRYFTQGIFSWDLFAVLVTLGAVKLVMMIYFFLTE